jgi:hypothetical protein
MTIRRVSLIDDASVTGCGFGLKLAARHLGEQKRDVPRTSFRGVKDLPHCRHRRRRAFGIP